MASIFGPLDKRQRAASHAAAGGDAEITFEDRADLLNDLLEDDDTTFPITSCPPEVLSSILLLSPALMALRMRPLCSAMRSAIDGNAGFWSMLTIRDFAEMGGMTKHYRGLRTLADAWDPSLAVRRLEWDPVMICAPPALRYALLATGQARARQWNQHGRSLGAGWAWFSAKVCRRMALSTFFRWASLQYEEPALKGLLPRGQADNVSAGRELLHQDAQAQAQHRNGPRPSKDGVPSSASNCAMRFRCGRSDAVTLSADAVSDIFETVQKWHTKEHCEMMRRHMKGEEEAASGEGSATNLAVHGSSFSATPTLDAAEAAAFAAGPIPNEPPQPQEEQAGSTTRGAASRRIEEAQLRLALEISKAEADSPNADEAGAGTAAQSAGKASVAANSQDTAGLAEQKSSNTATKALVQPHSVASKVEAQGLQIRGEGQGPELLVFLKDNCLGQRVDTLPDALEKSIEHIVHKMTGPDSWGFLYESVTEELGFRAKLAAYALCASHRRAVDELLSVDISLEQERMCLPIWRTSAQVMTDLSKLRTVICDSELREARCQLLKQAVLEWYELEDLTEFLDMQLAPLELAIDNFRALNEAGAGKAHTPHVKDIGRLMFRNFCLMDSRVFRSLCLAAYALVHEVHSAGFEGEKCQAVVDILEGLHSMLAACDVADDHLSIANNTKDAFGQHLVIPIAAAVERLTDLDVQGHPSRGHRSGR